jgi:hypothetical protein
MVPDIAMNADPQNGVEIIITLDQIPGDQQSVTVIGGTSLACPMFSGLWAMANQVAGVALGQAAPYLYNVTGNAITDVTAVSSPFNVAGIIFDPPNPPAFESADALAAPQRTLPEPVFDSLGCVHLWHRLFTCNWPWMGQRDWPWHSECRPVHSASCSTD